MASGSATLALKKVAVVAAIFSMLVIPSLGRCPSSSLGPVPPPPPPASSAPTLVPGPKVSCAYCTQCGNSCSSDCAAISCLRE
ncbi:hypothetical protein BRADI_4g11224v3 [Brachypodium distachyon]|uniref:4Fe-4S ferredoxin-type domain-containing protein n=1 Tax=Brachypodium distachyon TaxID=15368 RepID=A0A2K2CM28_BRADI|nr:hypothetical protein BRADI_4g11224v3 [Brachypodium distachyon]